MLEKNHPQVPVNRAIGANSNLLQRFVSIIIAPLGHDYSINLIDTLLVFLSPKIA